MLPPAHAVAANLGLAVGRGRWYSAAMRLATECLVFAVLGGLTGCGAEKPQAQEPRSRALPAAASVKPPRTVEQPEPSAKTEPALAKRFDLRDGRGCAVLMGGGVSCWGGREGGSPTRITSSQSVSDVAVGTDTLLVHQDGSVSALRQGGQIRSLAKVSDAAQAATQWLLSCVRSNQGSVSCYQNGVFKDSTPTAEERAPDALPGVKDAVDIAVGVHFVCAVHAKGGVACAHAGPESKGKLRATPIPGVSNAKRVQVATSVACAQLADGRVRCFSLGKKRRWTKEFKAADSFAVHQGDPYDSPLLCLSRAASVDCQRLESIGGGHALPTLPPGKTQFPDVKKLTQLRAVNHAVCGLTAEGSVHCFGHNINAVLGHPDTRYLESALPVAGVPSARGVGVGQRFACALTQSGEVWCWGLAATAQKSTALEPVRSKPKRVLGLSGMKRLIVHNAYGCAFDPKDQAHCFFGTESSSRARTPYRVADMDGVQSALLPEMGVLGPGGRHRQERAAATRREPRIRRLEAPQASSSARPCRCTPSHWLLFSALGAAR